MGWIKEAKANVAGNHAARARDEGRQVLVFLVDVPRSASQGSPISGVAEQIEAVEAEGWRLDHLAAKDAGSMVALFRRSS